MLSGWWRLALALVLYSAAGTLLVAARRRGLDAFQAAPTHTSQPLHARCMVAGCFCLGGVAAGLACWVCHCFPPLLAVLAAAPRQGLDALRAALLCRDMVRHLLGV